MTTQVQFRRGSTSDHALFTGAAGELTIDTDKNMAVIHDGVTTGGFDVFRARWELINTSQTLGTSLRYLVDTSGGAVTLTLPLTVKASLAVVVPIPTNPVVVTPRFPFVLVCVQYCTNPPSELASTHCELLPSL